MTDTTILDQDRDAGFGDYFALLKPRVMSLVVFTALVGLLVAPGQINPFVGLCAILFIAVGGGASGALNMWWDADIDARMKRTIKRPIPAGKVEPGEALGLGVALTGFSVILLFLATNWVAGALLAFTIFFYVVIYTMWLKRWTPQNIVIGGAAGAIPPMVGWAAVTGSLDERCTASAGGGGAGAAITGSGARSSADMGRLSAASPALDAAFGVSPNSCSACSGNIHQPSDTATISEAATASHRGERRTLSLALSSPSASRRRCSRRKPRSSPVGADSACSALTRAWSNGCSRPVAARPASWSSQLSMSSAMEN